MRTVPPTHCRWSLLFLRSPRLAISFSIHPPFSPIRAHHAAAPRDRSKKNMMLCIITRKYSAPCMKPAPTFLAVLFRPHAARRPRAWGTPARPFLAKCTLCPSSCSQESSSAFPMHSWPSCASGSQISLWARNTCCPLLVGSQYLHLR
jgi:hypothetical protein